MKLVFVFPYKGVGGVSLLFLRLGEYISKNYDYEVFLVDYKDGFMSKNSSESIKLIEYSDSAFCELPSQSIVVFQTMTPWTIFPNLRFSEQIRLFFWNCHPYNLVPHVPLIDKRLKSNQQLNKIFLKTFLSPYWRKCQRFLTLLVEKNAIAFMDSTNKATTEFFYFGVGEQKYLPIPAASKKSVNLIDALPETGTIHAVWLGRIVDFKYHILTYTLKELDKIQSRVKSDIVFTIIGGGEYCKKLELDAKNLNSIKVKFLDYVAPETLDYYLNHNVDIMFAMGTSALEAAKLGIPTILLDVFYGELTSEYQYQFLFERDGSTLGDVIEVSKFNNCPKENKNTYNVSLFHVFEKLQCEYGTLSKKTKEYYSNNHSIDKVSSELLERINHSRLTYKDLQKARCVDKGILYKLKKLLN